MNKMFAFFSLNPKGGEYSVVLKCAPEKTEELREKYHGIVKGYYAGNSLAWNSVYIEQDVPNKLIVELIQHSVEEVIKKLPRKKQEEYKALNVNNGFYLSDGSYKPIRWFKIGEEELLRYHLQTTNRM